MKSYRFFILSFFISLFIHGQDTVSVFFTFASSNIAEDQFEKLNLMPTQYDMNDLIAIKFIGITDSVGKNSDNLKLSAKRASAVKNFCDAFIPKNIPNSIIALGERKGKDVALSRRVDVLLYFKPNKPELLQNPGIEPPPGCYYIDYFVLHRVKKQIVQRKGITYVVLEAAELTLERANQNFYASIEKDGKVAVHPIKWVARKTGKLWWKGVRYISEIPKVEFDRFKIFRIEDKPCNKCHEYLIDDKTINNEFNCEQVDRFLMKNIQVKPVFLDHNKIQIRVAREFVDLNEQYYTGCDLTNRIFWRKENGRHHKAYYYATVPLGYPGYLANIVRTMKCCKSDPEPSECNRPIVKYEPIMCGTRMNRGVFLSAEVGSHLQMNELVSYASIGASKYTKFGQLLFYVGANNKKDLHASFRLQFRVFSILMRSLNPVSSWQQPNKGIDHPWYLALHAGSEMKLRYNSSRSNLIDDNINLELALLNGRQIEMPIISRVFVNYGYAYDLTGNYSKTFYPVLHFGLQANIRILSKNPLSSFGGLD